MKVGTTKFGILAAALFMGACSFAPGQPVALQQRNQITPFPAQMGGSAPVLNYSTAAMTPSEWRSFCQRHQMDCAARADQTFVLTDKAWRVLNQANHIVNRRLKYVEDYQNTGQADRWDAVNLNRLTPEGDCEDSALTKRQLLIKAGVPANILRLAIVQRPNIKDRVAANHAVLIVATNEGDFVLDSLDYRIQRVSQTPYRFLKVHTPTSGQPNQWHWVHGGHPVVAMNASDRDAIRLAKATRQ